MEKGKLYQLEVGDSLTLSHGWRGYLIWELYVPKIGVVANEKNGCFKSECRAKGETIDVEIDDDYVKAMETRAVSYDLFRKFNKEYFDVVMDYQSAFEKQLKLKQQNFKDEAG
jgi:hypothetical protein